MISDQLSELEIACDESGYEGGKLIDTTTDVFAHASVAMDMTPAAECIRELRERIRSPAEEYKAGHILRQKHRDVLTWFLGESSPLQGQAHVYLIDKEYFLLGALVDLVGGGESTRDWPGILYHRRREGPDGDTWHRFLVAANDLLRSDGRADPEAFVDAFTMAAQELRSEGVDEPVRHVLGQLSQTRRHADDWWRGPTGDHFPFAFDPLTPAIIAAVVHWGAVGRPIVVLHDQQNTLSPARIAHLTGLINASGTSARLARVSLVDSRWDPRVQVADIVGGAIRKIAQDALNGCGDAELVALLPPFVSPRSIWGDAKSRPAAAPVMRLG